MENYNDPQGQDSWDQDPQEQNPQQPEPQDQPQASSDLDQSINKQSKQWATICHLAAFAGFIGIPLGNVLGPLVIWLIKKEEMPFVNSQGKKALNFQISMSIYGLATLLLLCLPPLAMIWGFAVVVVDIIFVIIAAIKASDGLDYKYPLTIEFLK